MLCGGISQAKDAAGDERIAGVTADLKKSVEDALGKTFNTFEPIKFTQQVVNGMNYQIKIKVDEGYVHAKCHQATGVDGVVTFKEATAGKTLEDGF